MRQIIWCQWGAEWRVKCAQGVLGTVGRIKNEIRIIPLTPMGVVYTDLFKCSIFWLLATNLGTPPRATKNLGTVWSSKVTILTHYLWER